MTHATRFVAVVVLVALAAGAPVQAQTPEIDALRVRAEAGNAVAQCNLALRYDTGDGVQQDDVEAVRWYRLAADQGYARAQHNLGVMYGTGAGVPQDDVLAHMWPCQPSAVAMRSTGWSTQFRFGPPSSVREALIGTLREGTADAWFKKTVKQVLKH